MSETIATVPSEVTGSKACGRSGNPRFDGLDPVYKRVLWAAMLINAAMFLIEIPAGKLAGSQALQADALDFPGDTLTYPEHCTSSEKLARLTISGDGEVGIGDRERFFPAFPAVQAASEGRQQATRPVPAVVAGGPGRSSPHAVA